MGTTSNSASLIRKDLSRVIEAFKDFSIDLIFLVESDSTDSTVSVLEGIKDNLKNFDYVSFGFLRNQFPNRIDRIRYCRNIYVQKIREYSAGRELEFVVVVDLDGMNSKLTLKGVRSIFRSQEWDVVLANQLGGYYDLLALRHPSWCPSDVLEELKIIQKGIDKSHISLFAILKRFKRRLAFDKARRTAIYSKMRIISPFSSWIKVDSGFGGLGIYRSGVFLNHDYSVDDSSDLFESEHVTLSRKICKSGGSIYINPRLINNFFNTYNINRYILIRQSRDIYWNFLRKIKTRAMR